ncbi:MAG: hypothetical protein OEV92_04850 [Nitrospinota bacterium]|nr:hypothetical protein [Nitrospinota bacterium]
MFTIKNMYKKTSISELILELAYEGSLGYLEKGAVFDRKAIFEELERRTSAGLGNDIGKWMRWYVAAHGLPAIGKSWVKVGDDFEITIRRIREIEVRALFSFWLMDHPEKDGLA